MSAPQCCRGCGAPITQPLTRGRRREWCSDKCRKRQYDRPCVDCGTPIDGTTPSRKAERCPACASRRAHEDAAIEAAGFAPRAPHGGDGNMDRRRSRIAA